MRHILGLILATLVAGCTAGAALRPATPALTEAAAPATSTAAPILQILESELLRASGQLRERADPPPYFVAYQLTDLRDVEIAASYGALEGSHDGSRRRLDVDVRVGDYLVDNTRRLRDEPFSAMWGSLMVQPALLPLENEPDALRTAIWLETNDAYRRAAERYVKVRANLTVKVAEEDPAADFSRERPVEHLEAPAAASVDRPAWEARVRRLSGIFREYQEVLASRVTFNLRQSTRYFVNTEGTRVQQPRLHASLNISGRALANDGMELELHHSFDASDPADLPADEVVERAIRSLAERLRALREAPLAEPYVGPAILEGPAAGVFFHEIFGHRVEGHRQKDEDEGQTFAGKIGKRVMPAFIDVYDDPLITRVAGVELNGSYRIDDEGVLAQRANLVTDGVLGEFLMSRSPTRGFTRSNGHGRREAGYPVVARQANLVVHPSGAVSPAALKQRLLAEVKRQKKPYGLLFSEVTGGYTTTMRQGTQAFKVMPLVVYRVYPDGREELLRGADLEGTPLTALSTILAAADDYAVFNGWCGAESGSVPVSAVSPSLLVGQVEVARRGKNQDKPPILPPPGTGVAP